ncbi:MAG TPA: peptide ABC transporter substrate-binding protein [Candidatus Baltobacteraceae bacterium]|nr:peptide ABC transporter substrate-binding protein [Candidatus Baltobacteraceae bacterium]
MRRFCVFLLCAVLLSGCGGMHSRLAGAGDVLRIADPVDPPSLNPLLAHDQTTIGYDLLVCQTLVGIDASNRLVPILVTRIPSRENGGVSRDGRVITYHLRHGVRFADGRALTSADVAFTYRAIVDRRNNVLSVDAYQRIASLAAPDPYTVVIRLKSPWNAAVTRLFAQSDFAFGILPAHAFKDTRLQRAPWEQRPFGSGPFRVAQWQRGDRIVLERNPYFRPVPKLARIVLRIIPNTDAAFDALRAHDVDIGPLYPEMIAQARASANLSILRTPENATVWLSLLTSREPTSDARVRRAIAYAIDMHTVAGAYDHLYPQAAAFLPPVLAWHDARMRPYPYDPAKARALLGNHRIDALLVVQSEEPLFTRIATIVQQQLANAGIGVTIKEFPTALYNAPEGPIRNARFTIAIDGWLGGADPEQSVVFTCAQATVDGSNISRYCDPRFEALFRDQERTGSAAQRARDFQQMQQLIHDDVPVIPLYYETYEDGVSTRVHGFERNMLRYPVAPETWSVR